MKEFFYHNGDDPPFLVWVTVAGDGNLWETISEMAKDRRRNQLNENPPKRKVPRKQSARGGARPNSGRKKSIPKVGF